MNFRQIKRYFKKNRQNGFIVLVAAVAVILMVAITLFKSCGKNDGDESVSEDSISIDLAIGFVSADAVSEDAAEEEEKEPAPGTVSSDLAARFYEGYKVVQDSREKYISDPEVISEYAVLIDMSDGHIVASRNPKDKIYPASMTKVLAILTACDLLDSLSGNFVMTQDITNYTFSHDCSAVCYSVGEEMSVEELFYGTILPSGADACLGLADVSAGSMEAFVDEMNKKVDELGLSATSHFANPVGIFDKENYSTPCDIAMIMKAALEKDICRKALSKHHYVTAKTKEHPDGIDISNWFLRRIEDKDPPGEVLAGKTGFVSQSMFCAVSCLENTDGNLFILCTAGSSSSWKAIYDHARIYRQFASGTVSKDSAVSENQ